MDNDPLEEGPPGTRGSSERMFPVLVPLHHRTQRPNIRNIGITPGELEGNRPLAAKPGRYRPPDSLLAFLEAL